MASITNIAQQHDPAAPDGRPGPDLWDAFWTLYPRHEAKKAASKAWERMSEAQRHAAVVAISDWRYVWRAQARDASLIPHPATWLNGERWEDEIPRGLIPKSVAAVDTEKSGTGPVPPVAGEIPRNQQLAAVPRQPIPAHILAQLARIKEGR